MLIRNLNINLLVRKTTISMIFYNTCFSSLIKVSDDNWKSLPELGNVCQLHEFLWCRNTLDLNEFIVQILRSLFNAITSSFFSSIQFQGKILGNKE